jgi:isoleucyl-tRNA synthetase
LEDVLTNFPFYSAYRLYTVGPRAVELIGEMTNWYIRFNRARLKGENGSEDAVAALNTLYETLMTVSLILVSREKLLYFWPHN